MNGLSCLLHNDSSALAQPMTMIHVATKTAEKLTASMPMRMGAGTQASMQLTGPGKVDLERLSAISKS